MARQLSKVAEIFNKLSEALQNETIRIQYHYEDMQSLKETQSFLSKVLSQIQECQVITSRAIKHYEEKAENEMNNLRCNIYSLTQEIDNLDFTNKENVIQYLDNLSFKVKQIKDDLKNGRNKQTSSGNIG